MNPKNNNKSHCAVSMSERERERERESWLPVGGGERGSV